MNTTMNKHCGCVRPQQAQLARKARPRLDRSSTQHTVTSTPEAGKPLKPDAASLKEAIRLAQQGDAAAFETIYQLHSRRVYALCLRMIGDPVEAEDRLDRRNDCDVIAQQREIAGSLALGLQYRHGSARHCGLEAEGEEDDLLVRVVARDLQRVERRIDDAHVGPVRFGKSISPVLSMRLTQSDPASAIGCSCMSGSQ